MSQTPQTGAQALCLLHNWATEGGLDIKRALLDSPLLRSEALMALDRQELRFTPIERLMDLITGLAACPGTARAMMKLIDEDKMPMNALTGEAFLYMNRQSEDEM